MNLALYFAPDAALLLLLLRMIFVGAERSAWREFLFLNAWFFYSLLTLHSSFPAWGHLAVWTFAAPLAASSTTGLLSASRPPSTQKIFVAGTALSLVAASALGAAAVARWGASSTSSGAARFALLGALFAIALGCALLVSFFLTRPLRPLRCGIGIYLFAFYGGALLGFPVALLAILSTAAWLATAFFIAPRGDLLFNLEKLAVVFPLRASAPSACPQNGRRAVNLRRTSS